MAATPDSLKVGAVSTTKSNLHEVEKVEYVESAQAANDAEHTLRFIDAVKMYPNAVGWSLLLSTALIMEGYDLKLVPQMFAQPAFQRHFGSANEDEEYQLTAAWQSGLTNGTTVGSLMGLLTGGWVVERIGFRWTMIVSLAAVMGVIFIQFFAVNLVMLLIGQILMGMFSDQSFTYIVSRFLTLP